MKRIIATFVTFLSLCHVVAEARSLRGTPAVSPYLRQQNLFGITGTAWTSFTGNYTPGLGNPAVSTDDYYHSNGLSGFRPYDLTSADCGATGASIAASRGRYVWVLSPDHGQGGGAVWNGSFSFRVGFSNDPGVPPSRMTYILDSEGSASSSPTPTIATITASISNGSGGAGNILNVTSISGFITNAGQSNVSGAGVTTANITSQSSGTQGETGNYVIGGAAQFVASQTMTVTQSNYGIYYDASFICNPDDATYPFYIYAEGSGSSVQHQQGVIKSSDLVTWTLPQPTHIALNFGSWSSFQRVNRNGTGNWESIGFQIGYPQNGNTNARSKWTSADGTIWSLAPNSSFNVNACIPSSNQVGTSNSCSGNSIFVQPAQSPYSTTVNGTPWIIAGLSTQASGTRVGPQWVGRASIDASQNVVNTPAQVNISLAYEGNYPGPNYLQTVTGYTEDGIAHYWGVLGWPISSSLWYVTSYVPYSNGGACHSVPAVNGQYGYFQFNGSASGTTLTVNSVITNNIIIGSMIYGGGIANSANTRITGQLTGTPNGAGTYSLSASHTTSAGQTITGSACGGLWQQAVDYYTEVIDPTAAASAAPVGVRVTCAGGTASLIWYNSLPHQNYRVYRGTSAGSQPTLVGDVTGTSTTDTPGSDGVFYYKVVTINGTEQGHRVVSTYCSSSTAFVNAHMTRALAEGADASTCNKAWMDTFDAWLTSNSLSNNLLFATMVDFCVAKSGSVISKIFDMGTTRLPRGGDYTPTTSNTTYNATGINGNPAWVNGTNTSYGYYGGDRAYLNNIRRQTQITFFAAYQKPGTAPANPFVLGQFTNRLQVSHTSGSPGGVSCLISDGTKQRDATIAVSGSATTFHTMGCTYDGSEWKAWSDAVGGTAITDLVIPSPTLNPPDNLTGQIGVPSLTFLLMSGSETGYFNRGSNTISPTGNSALYSGAAHIIFDKALSGAQMTSLNTLIRTHYGL